MTVLAALQKAALRLAGRKPVAFFGASEGETLELELASLSETVADDIAKYHDWQQLTALSQVAGDGTAVDFPLPDDFDRFPLSGGIQDFNSWFWGYHHYADLDAFLFDEARDFNAAPGGWIIYGDRLRFAPAPAVAQSARFAYISKNYALAENGSPKPTFTADTDTFRLPERLLTLGLVWRWREDKGLYSAGDEAAFVKALDEEAGKDKGPTIIRRNGGGSRLNTHVAYPWELGPADYWPAA